MMPFRLHELSHDEFQEVVVLLCRELLGPTVTSFSEGKDGGKDAQFEGFSPTFQALGDKPGRFIIQAKHTSNPAATCSGSAFRREVAHEIPKIQKLAAAGRLTHYVLMTNRRKSGGAHDAIVDQVRAATGVQNVWLWAVDDLERELRCRPTVVKVSGLQKLRSPIQFAPDDMRDVILALHGQRSALKSTFDSQHDFLDYPGLAEKNRINGLTAEYNDYLLEDSGPHFHEIRRFLENARNESLAEQYHAVADDLKGQLITHRDRFENFDTVLEHIFQLVHERSPEVQPAARRRLAKVLVHYMYVNCDIGKKKS